MNRYDIVLGCGSNDFKGERAEWWLSLRILELDHREAEKHGMVGMGDFSIFSMHICHQDSFLIFFFKIEKILILKNTLQRF